MCGCARRARICRSRVKRRRRLRIGQAGAQQLQRDAALVQAVGARGQPDLAHAAFAEHAFEPVRADLGAGRARRAAARPAARTGSPRARPPARAVLRGRRRAADPPRAVSAQAAFARAASSSSNSASSSGDSRCQRSASIGSAERRQPSFSDASRNSRAFCQSRRMLRSERLQQRGDLQFRQAGEVAQLHHLRQALVDGGQPGQRGVQAEGFLVQAQAAFDVLGQFGDAVQVAAALLRQALARVVDHHAAHRRGGVGEEVRAVVELAPRGGRSA